MISPQTLPSDPFIHPKKCSEKNNPYPQALPHCFAAMGSRKEFNPGNSRTLKIYRRSGKKTKRSN